ncbi:MAG TPA: hypothetical protein VKA34_14890 [Balneolales bacterium]|nr:hypothetical protein [Balneolales bacterium]
MKKSLQTLLHKIIDYAGLFPPASLSLDQAIHNYDRYRRGNDQWLLSRFIIPATQLFELENYQDELFQNAPPFDFSVTGSKGDTIVDFLNNIKSDLRGIQQFHKEFPHQVTTQFYETKFPVEIIKAHDKQGVLDLLSEVMSLFEMYSPNMISIFYESVFDDEYKLDNQIVLDALAEHRQKVELMDGLNHYRFAGFKLRCGGVEAQMFPSPEQVVFALKHAVRHKLTMKATAGLHHPLRKFDKSVNTKMFGFLNVFISGILKWTMDLNDDQLKTIVEDENPENFVFEEEYLRWKNLEISVEQIEKARKEFLVSYGSCNFDEPREDLRHLGLMP